MASIGSGRGGISFPGGRGGDPGYKTAAPDFGNESGPAHIDRRAPSAPSTRRTKKAGAAEPVTSDIMRITLSIPRGKSDDLYSSISDIAQISKIEIFDGTSWHEVTQ